MLAMLAPTSSASLVSQEDYSEHSNSTTSDSLSNAAVNGDDVNSNNNFSSCPTTFLLYYWAIFCNFISNIFSKASLQSSGELTYMTPGAISPISPETNNNQSQQPLRRSPRSKQKKQFQQQTSTALEEFKAANSVVRMRHNKKQFSQTALSPSMKTSLLKAKTLILDLDETLVHSTSRGARTDAHMIEVMVDNHACLYYMHKRPHVDHFLKKVKV